MNNSIPKQYNIAGYDKSGNGLRQFCRQNELNKTREDNCYIQQRDQDSRKPFKLSTYHYHPYGSKVVATCYPGQFYSDGHVGGSNIDADSCVKLHPGNIMTNPNLPQQLPTLPIQMPQIEGWFDADIDSCLRPEVNYERFNGCANLSEKSFMPHTFQHFSQLCYNPSDPEYIIPEDTFNCTYPNGKFYHWGGQDSRHDRLEKYRNGCDAKSKYSPPNLNYSVFGY